MRRRSKRGPNESESTGKIGHELPTGQPAPLQPVYPDESHGPSSSSAGSTGSAGSRAEDAASNGSKVPSQSSQSAEPSKPSKPSERSERSARSGRSESFDAADTGSRQAESAAPRPQGGQASNSTRMPRRGRRRGGAGKFMDKLMGRPERVASSSGPKPNSGPKPSNEPNVGATTAGKPAPQRAEPAETGDSTAETAGSQITPESISAPEQAASQSTAGAGKLVVETQPESPSAAPPAPTAVSVKQPKGFVVLAIGLPGSGKTTWFKRRGVMPLSSDMLRGILFDDITEQRYQGLVFSTLRSLLRARLIAKMPWNYVDATNLSPHERRQWIKMARSFGYEVQAVFFDVPFAVCMERNRRRDRLVSEEAMQKMAERLRPPSFQEGFSKITMVRVKGAAGHSKPEESGQGEQAGQ